MTHLSHTGALPFVLRNLGEESVGVVDSLVDAGKIDSVGILHRLGVGIAASDHENLLLSPFQRLFKR